MTVIRWHRVCIKMDKEEIVDKALDISIYATDSRYPNELELDEGDVRRALEDSKEIMDWVKDAIDAPKIRTDTK